MPAKKKIFDIDVPLINTKARLLSYSIKELDNKTINIDLTRKLKGKGTEIIFKIKVKDDQATAKPIKLRVLPFFIKRMMRKRTSYVEDSFSAECKDAWLKIKPFLIARKKISRAVRKVLRQEAKTWLISYLKNKTKKEIFSEVIGNRIQKPFSIKLKKIYPLSLCEIRMLEVEKEKEKTEVKTEKVGTPKKEDKKSEQQVEEKDEKPLQKEKIKQNPKKVETDKKETIKKTKKKATKKKTSSKTKTTKKTTKKAK
jgi:ribosomal protein S3AE